MPWVAITEQDLNDARMGALITALRSAALGAGQTDPVDSLLGKIVKQVRDAIAFGYGSIDGAASDTVPDSLVLLVCRLALWEAKGRLELDRTFDESDHREDLRALERIRAGKEPMEMPETAATAEIAGTAAVVIGGKRKRVADQGGVDGLL